MKLLSVALARSVWLVYLSDLNPRGRNLYPLISSFLLDTYRFQKYPKTADDLDETKGIIFNNGEQNSNDKNYSEITSSPKSSLPTSNYEWWNESWTFRIPVGLTAVGNQQNAQHPCEGIAPVAESA